MVKREDYNICLKSKKKLRKGKRTKSELKIDQHECSWKDLQDKPYFEDKDFERFDIYAYDDLAEMFSKKELQTFQDKINNRIKHIEQTEHRLVRNIDKEGRLSMVIRLAIDSKDKK